MNYVGIDVADECVAFSLEVIPPFFIVPEEFLDSLCVRQRIHSHVDHRGAGLDKLGKDKSSAPHRRHEDIRS